MYLWVLKESLGKRAHPSDRQPQGPDFAKKSKGNAGQEQFKGPDGKEGLSENEKTFDEQFKRWEEQFQAWKKQNQNHPNKVSIP